MIEDYYTNDEAAPIIGLAEDGKYYAYILESGVASDSIPALGDNILATEVLGGNEVAIAPLFLGIPGTAGWYWLAGGVAAAGLAALLMRSKHNESTPKDTIPLSDEDHAKVALDEAKAADAALKQALQDALADGVITPEEKAKLDSLKTDADNKKAAAADKALKDAIAKAQENGTISPEEAKEIEDLKATADAKKAEADAAVKALDDKVDGKEAFQGRVDALKGGEVAADDTDNDGITDAAERQSEADVEPKVAAAEVADKSLKDVIAKAQENGTISPEEAKEIEDLKATADAKKAEADAAVKALDDKVDGKEAFQGRVDALTGGEVPEVTPEQPSVPNSPLPEIVEIPENSNGGINNAEAADGTPVKVIIPEGLKAGDEIVLTVTKPNGAGTETIPYVVKAEDQPNSTVDIIIPADKLAADGNYTVTAKSKVKVAGQPDQESAATAPTPFVVDKTAPAQPVVTIRDASGQAEQLDPSDLVNGKGKAVVTFPQGAVGDTVVITKPDNSVERVTLTQAHLTSGYEVTFDPVQGKANVVKAYIEDAAGNRSGEGQDSTTVNFATTPATVQTNFTGADQGKVVVTPQGSETNKVVVNYTNEQNAPVTLTATKGANGVWTLPNKPADVEFNPQTGVITLSPNAVKDGQAVNVVSHNGQTEAASPAATAANDKQADRPTVTPNNSATTAAEKGSVTVTPGQDNDKVVISYTREANSQGATITAVKQNGSWSITGANPDNATIDSRTGVVKLSPFAVKDNSNVEAVSHNSLGATNNHSGQAGANADFRPNVTAIPENNNGGVNNAEASDGTPVKVSIPAGVQVNDKILLVVTKPGGAKETIEHTVTVSDKQANAATITIPANQLTDGNYTVAAKAKVKVPGQPDKESAEGQSMPFVVDKTAPNAPTITFPENTNTVNVLNKAESDAGTANSTPVRVNLPTPVATHLKAGDKVEVTINGQKKPVYVLSAEDINKGYVDFEQPLEQGTTQITASAVVIDSVGNTSQPGQGQVGVDVKLPEAPTFTAQDGALTVNLPTDSDVKTVHFTVPQENGQNVNVVLTKSGNTWTATEGANIVNVAGNVVTIPAANVHDTTPVQGWSVDTADNRGATNTAPAAGAEPIRQLTLAFANDTRGDKYGVTTGSTTDKVSKESVINVGNIPSGQAWEYQIDNGNWVTGTGSTITLPDNQQQAGKQYTVKARLKDAQHQAVSSVTETFTLDKVAPRFTSQTIYTGAKSLEGTVTTNDPGSKVILRANDGSVTRETNVQQNGKFVISNFSPVGSKDYTLTVVDKAGNESVENFKISSLISVYEGNQVAAQPTGSGGKDIVVIGDLNSRVGDTVNGQQYNGQIRNTAARKDDLVKYQTGDNDDSIYVHGSIERFANVETGAGNDNLDVKYIYGERVRVDMGSGDDVLTIREVNPSASPAQGISGNHVTGDTLVGNGFISVNGNRGVYLGDGNDKVRMPSAWKTGSDSVLNGGSGFDTIELTTSGRFETSELKPSRISGFEKIDLRGSGSNSLIFPSADHTQDFLRNNNAQSVTVTRGRSKVTYNNVFMVQGDSNDSISTHSLTKGKLGFLGSAAGGGIKDPIATGVVHDGVTYNVYEIGSYKLFVSPEVQILG